MSSFVVLYMSLRIIMYGMACKFRFTYAVIISLGCCIKFIKIHFYPSALRAGGVLSSRSGRTGGRAVGRAAARLAEPISL